MAVIMTAATAFAMAVVVIVTAAPGIAVVVSVIVTAAPLAAVGDSIHAGHGERKDGGQIPHALPVSMAGREKIFFHAVFPPCGVFASLRVIVGGTAHPQYMQKIVERTHMKGKC